MKDTRPTQNSHRLGVSDGTKGDHINSLLSLSVRPNHPPRAWSRLVGFFCLLVKINEKKLGYIKYYSYIYFVNESN